jgi:acyl-CoA thioesterase FadM
VDSFARYLGDPGAVTKVHARFSRPVALEDTLTFKGVVTDVDGNRLKATVRAENQKGQEVLKDVRLEGHSQVGRSR